MSEGKNISADINFQSVKLAFVENAPLSRHTNIHHDHESTLRSHFEHSLLLLLFRNSCSVEQIDLAPLAISLACGLRSAPCSFDFYLLCQDFSTLASR